MASLPYPPDTASTCTDPHVDGCANCVTNVEPPEDVQRLTLGCLAYYRCGDCGYTWTTDWRCV
jgi:hypothetical protein